MKGRILTAGEWEALLSDAIPGQYQMLIQRLAVYHGAIPPGPCPTCGQARPIAPEGDDDGR